MKRWNSFYIAGEWVPAVSSRPFGVVNPATEEPFEQIFLGSAEDIDAAVKAACDAFPAFSTTSRAFRLSLLDKMIAAYEKRLDEIAETISKEMGAPLWFSRKYQAPAALSNLRTARAVLQDYPFETSLGAAKVLHEAAGVCGLITPWNWPINQIACKVGPALAAGCTMVLKPSEVAPLNATLFAEVVHEAGLPPGVFNMVHGDGETAGAALVAHPRIDVVSFTGSTRAGVMVETSAAKHIKRTALELGGKSANIILESAEFEGSVRAGVRRCYNNSGQSCSAPTRMLLRRNRFEEAVAIAKAEAEAVVVGPPEKDGVDLGPLVSEAQFDRVQALVRSGIEEGALLVTGGEGRPTGLETGYYVKPTVFAPVDNQMRIAQEEIFGPVLCMIPYEDVDDAVRIANDSRYGLSGYVSGEPEEAEAVARRLRTGSVQINGAAEDFAAPFGGYRQSGIGRERGVFGLQEFLEAKAVMHA